MGCSSSPRRYSRERMSFIKKTDQWSGIALLILSALVCWKSILMPYGGLSHPRAGFLPLWYGIVLGALSIGLILKATVAKRESRMVREIFDEDVQWGKVLLTLILLLLFAFSVEYVGFVLATFLFMVALLRLIEYRPWKTVIGWAIVGSVGSFLIFVVCLKLRLPKGFLGM